MGYINDPVTEITLALANAEVPEEIIDWPCPRCGTELPISLGTIDQSPKTYYLHCDTCHECEDVTHGNGSPEFNAAHKGHNTRVASIP